MLGKENTKYGGIMAFFILQKLPEDSKVSIDCLK
jgi:hypothetical protein